VGAHAEDVGGLVHEKKGHDASFLKEILKCGTYSIKAESEELEHRKRCGRNRTGPRKLE